MHAKQWLVLDSTEFVENISILKCLQVTGLQHWVKSIGKVSRSFHKPQFTKNHHQTVKTAAWMRPQLKVLPGYSWTFKQLPLSLDLPLLIPRHIWAEVSLHCAMPKFCLHQDHHLWVVWLTQKKPHFMSYASDGRFDCNETCETFRGISV